jgi:hypothetical protein
MKNIEKFGLNSLEYSDLVHINGGTLNLGEWLMYNVGKLKHKISSWAHSTQFPNPKNLNFQAKGDCPEHQL